jgi:hypothetical protein
MLGIIFVRLRIAKVHEHAVAHELRNEPAEALHGLGDALLIGGNDLAEVFRVHPRRECCRTDEVREHHRYLTALGGVLRLWRSLGGGLRCRGGRTCQLADGGEHYPPMPEQDANVLEVLISQMRECRNTNPVLGKALRVLGHAELFEPIRNFSHCGAPSATVVWDTISDRRSDVNRPLRLGFCPLSRFKAAEMNQRERYRLQWVGGCP